MVLELAGCVANHAGHSGVIKLGTDVEKGVDVENKHSR